MAGASSSAGPQAFGYQRQEAIKRRADGETLAASPKATGSRLR